MTTTTMTHEDETPATEATEATEAPLEAEAEDIQAQAADDEANTVRPTDASPEPAEAERTDRPGNEAARYRRQLRTTEAERDALRTELDQMRTAVAEEAVADLVTKPAALWLTGLNVADYFVDGALDTQALRTAAQAAAAEHGLATPRRFQGPAGGPPSSSGSRTSAQGAPTWSDVLRS